MGTKVTENMDHLDPESVIVPADALCAQALEAQAEDMALEDTLYALDKALQQGVIDLDAYLKQVYCKCFYCEKALFNLVCLSFTENKLYGKGIDRSTHSNDGYCEMK